MGDTAETATTHLTHDMPCPQVRARHAHLPALLRRVRMRAALAADSGRSSCECDDRCLTSDSSRGHIPGRTRTGASRQPNSSPLKDSRETSVTLRHPACSGDRSAGQGQTTCHGPWRRRRAGGVRKADHGDGRTWNCFALSEVSIGWEVVSHHGKSLFAPRFDGSLTGANLYSSSRVRLVIQATSARRTLGPVSGPFVPDAPARSVLCLRCGLVVEMFGHASRPRTGESP